MNKTLEQVETIDVDTNVLLLEAASNITALINNACDYHHTYDIRDDKLTITINGQQLELPLYSADVLNMLAAFIDEVKDFATSELNYGK